jgi:sterol desaturase/sphingolipid hydroxylase (fatty acid hydroxylase superfamily)
MILCGFGLLVFHVHAENINDEDQVKSPLRIFWNHIVSGPENWTAADKGLFGALILLAFELLNFITKNYGVWFHSKQIPVRGKHLDELSPKDNFFIALSKAQTAPFTYFYLRYCIHEKNIVWGLDAMSFANVLLPLPVMYIVFDFFYTIFHWALHIKAIYGYIHKHHHHQKAPSRANVDAVNVHPIEFFLGEYNHLLTVYLWCCVGNMRLHIVGALLFLGVGGILAGLNHTRFDICFCIFGVAVFDSKFHDVHHRIPQSNYGQFSVFWDHIFGTFRYVVCVLC